MKLAYEVALPSGKSEQNLPPVILLHGMMDSRKTWKQLAHKLANSTGRRVYVLDARNHGESPWDDTFNFDVMAEDLEEFLNDHQIVRATVIGHSMGGRTALTLALKKPERVEKLIVEDMTPRNFSPRAGGIVVHMLRLLRESLSAIPAGADDETARKSIMAFMYALLPPEQTSSSKAKFDLSMLPIRRQGNGFVWQANLDVIEHMLTSDEIRQQLSGVYMGDTLFLYGTKSFFKVETDELIPIFFPHARRVGIQGAGHLIHHECPQQFFEEVVSFIHNNRTLQSQY